ncbi:Pyridoxal-dependent decarboxylase domain protein, partial [Trichostrongylus colubriformis]
EQPPTEPESWQEIFASLEEIVLNGSTHWNHPLFFAHHPVACCYPSILGDILSSGIGTVGFSWMSGPSLTELEMTTLDWLVDLLGLPEHFKNFHPGIGSSLIQTTAGEATLTAIITARATAVEAIKNEGTSYLPNPYVKSTIKEILDKVRQNTAHPFLEKAVMLNAVKLRKLKCSIHPEMKNYTVMRETLEEAIKEDRERGLIPFLMIASMGTKKTCSFDRLDDLGPVCYRERIYLHVDAAYG